MARVLLANNLEPVDDLTWDQLHAMILEEEWTQEQFRETYKRLLKTKTYVLRGDSRPRWQIGDWFRIGEAKHYGYDWYLARTPAERAQIEAYRVKGYKKARYAWRREAEGILEPLPAITAVAAPPGSEAYASIYGNQEVQALPAAMADDTRAVYDMTLLQVRISELEEELERQQRDNARLRVRLEQKSEEIAQLRAQLQQPDSSRQEASHG